MVGEGGEDERERLERVEQLDVFLELHDARMHSSDVFELAACLEESVRCVPYFEVEVVEKAEFRS